MQITCPLSVGREVFERTGRPRKLTSADVGPMTMQIVDHDGVTMIGSAVLLEMRMPGGKVRVGV